MPRRRVQLATDPTAPIECHRIDNRFVPLRVCDLARALGEDSAAAGIDREHCSALIAGISAVIEQEAAAFRSELDDAYSFFNPDRETLPLDADAAARTPEGYEALGARLQYLLDKANFEQLDDVAVDRALAVASSYGIRVQLDPSKIESFSIFVRGSGTIERHRRQWRAPIKGRPVSLSVFRRLVVIARLKDDAHILIKMFKDIPEADVEALLPHAEVTMNWIDRLFMVGGGAGVVGTTATQVVKLLSASLLVFSRLLWVILFGGIMLIWRTISGYSGARNKRDAVRTRHLYFQNVSNNAGAIHMLTNMTAQEEIKEAAITYFLCALANEPVQSEAALGLRAEQYLRKRFGINVDFDVTDAVKTLDRLDLWQDRPSFRVLPAPAAVARLHEHWVQCRSQQHHHRCAELARTPVGAQAAAKLSAGTEEAEQS
jgi:hypothetical protein